MKNYSTYKKTKCVYFSGEFAFPLGLVLIASFVSYGLLYFLGLLIALLFNVIISCCAYFYIYYYGKSTTIITFGFIKGVVLMFSVLLFVDYGIYSLVVYQETGIFNRFYFQIWLTILIGIPVSYYTFHYGRYCFLERKMATNYLKVVLDINHDRELLTYIDAIQFINTVKKQCSDIKLEKPPCFYSEQELKKMENNTRNYHLEKDVFSEMIFIPFGTNQLKMAWFSIIENEYYDIELDFPFEKLPIEKQKYQTNVSSTLRGKKTKPLTLHIHANGGARLFNSDTIFINHLRSVPNVITSELIDQKRKQHQLSHEFYNDSEQFFNLIEKIKTTRGIEERFLIQNKLFCWKMHFSGLKGENYFEVIDVAFLEYKSEISDLKESVLRFLPKKIDIIYKGDYLYRWLILRINTQRLYHCIKEITNQNEEDAVSFDLVFQDSDKTNLVFTISTNEKSIQFTDWEIEIDKNRKGSMDKYLLDNGRLSKTNVF